MTRDDLKALAQGVVHAFRTGRPEDVDAALAPTFHSVTLPWIGADRSREGVKADIATLRTAIPDVEFSIDEVIARDNMVYMRWRMSGTHHAPLLGVEPSGCRITHAWQEVFTGSDDGIIERRGHEDRLELSEKLRRAATIPR